MMLYRSKRLLDMARGRHCLLNYFDCLSPDTSTTVAAHSNQLKHGKGTGIKAEDVYTVWACVNCHSWLDQGRASKEAKKMEFDAAHKRQIKEWRAIADDKNEKTLDRECAIGALAYLKEHENT